MARPSGLRTRRAAPPYLRRRIWQVIAVSTPLLLLVSLHAFGSALRRANCLGRRCMSAEPGGGGPGGVRIAMVSFSDEGVGGFGGDGRRLRSFVGLMEAVRSNKAGYAARWGYDFIDAGDSVDRSRPASWSKILAIRSHLASYDWIFWNDADSLVTNPNVTLEGILHSAIGPSDFDASPDLIVTEDTNGINAGMFFVRRSKWSEEFLDTWWNQTAFVRLGSTKSGDNDAMKHLIHELPTAERREHVRVAPMQCLFNSYPWFPTWKNAHRLIRSPHTAWRGAYSRGDFMVHFAGLDDKKKWAVRILGDL